MTTESEWQRYVGDGEEFAADWPMLKELYGSFPKELTVSFYYKRPADSLTIYGLQTHWIA